MSTILLFAAATGVAEAQPLIEEQQQLSFGAVAITGNSSISQISYSPTNNTMSMDGQFALIAPGSSGRYRLTGFPAYTTLTVSLDNTTLIAGATGISEPLIVDSFDYANPVTNSLGIAELTLGARVSTTGNGGSYVDAPYSGTTVLRVDYWQPTEERFVTNSMAIELEMEQRSTLVISEEQQLHFGTLFARSSTTSQAVLTLLPSGSYTLSEPDNSRLVSLEKPRHGVIRVSTAAPNYSLQISPQVEDVLLQHTENPGSAPHLILSDLNTTPDGTGTTDANGEILISVGGTLKTEQTATPEVYPSGQYEGTYELTVSY